MNQVLRFASYNHTNEHESTRTRRDAWHDLGRPRLYGPSPVLRQIDAAIQRHEAGEDVREDELPLTTISQHGDIPSRRSRRYPNVYHTKEDDCLWYYCFREAGVEYEARGFETEVDAARAMNARIRECGLARDEHFICEDE